jgi:hypothetical protein
MEEADKAWQLSFEISYVAWTPASAASRVSSMLSLQRSQRENC